MRIPCDVGGDGISYTLWIQQRDHSCLAACLATVAWLAKDRMFTEQFSRTLLEIAREKTKRADQLANGLPVVNRGVPDVGWADKGLRMKYLEAALSQLLRLPTQRVNKPQLADVLPGVRARKPVVLGVMRKDGFHGVVVVNETPTHYVVLDPALGLVLTHKDETELFDEYRPCRFNAETRELDAHMPSRGGSHVALKVG